MQVPKRYNPIRRLSPERLAALLRMPGVISGSHFLREDCPHERLRDSKIIPLLPAPIPPRLLENRAVSHGSTDFDDLLSLAVHRVEQSQGLVHFLAAVLSDDQVMVLLAQPLGDTGHRVVEQLALAGKESCRFSRLDPWQKEVLYVATLLQAVQVQIRAQREVQHCSAEDQLREISRAAWRQLRREDPMSARMLGQYMDWETGEEEASDPYFEQWRHGQRQHMLRGLRAAGFLKRGI